MFNNKDSRNGIGFTSPHSLPPARFFTRNPSLPRDETAKMSQAELGGGGRAKKQHGLLVPVALAPALVVETMATVRFGYHTRVVAVLCEL